MGGKSLKTVDKDAVSYSREYKSGQGSLLGEMGKPQVMA